jgi:hypothetical protein
MKTASLRHGTTYSIVLHNNGDCLRAYLDGPVIQCETREADRDEYNVYLCCQVRAKPEVTSLFWIVDVNGTTLADGDFTNGYWSMVKVGVCQCTRFLRHDFDLT